MYKKRPQNYNSLALCSMQGEVRKWGTIPGIRQNNNNMSSKAPLLLTEL